jgi:hypothetical protein
MPQTRSRDSAEPSRALRHRTALSMGTRLRISLEILGQKQKGSLPEDFPLAIIIDTLFCHEIGGRLSHSLLDGALSEPGLK